MRCQRAFTLVEILVVIVISAILAGVTLLSMRDAGSAELLAGDINRLAALLRHNCRDALVYGQHLGIGVTDRGYAVYRHDGTGWKNIEAESALFRQRGWSNDWHLQLSFQGQDSTITHSTDTPQLICLGSGELLPFRFSLSDGQGAALALTGYADGKIVVGALQ